MAKEYRHRQRPRSNTHYVLAIKTAKDRLNNGTPNVQVLRAIEQHLTLALGCQVNVEGVFLQENG